MNVFFDLDRTLMNFEGGEDMGIKAVYDTYRNQMKMDYQEFRSTWKVVAQKIFDEYSASRGGSVIPQQLTTASPEL